VTAAVAVPRRRYRLGAEELLELGRARNPQPVAERKPFLASRLRKPMLRQTPQRAPESVFILDVLGSVAGFVADGLSLALGALGTLVDLPLGILSQGVDVAFNGLAGLFGGIPGIGGFLSQILLLGGSLIKFGLSVPGLLLHGLGNIMGGVAKFLKGENSEGKNQDNLDGAKEEIISKAPPGLKDNVKKILDASGVTGGNLTPNVGSTGTPRPDVGTPGAPGAPGAVMPGDVSAAPSTDLETALAIGVPAVGAIALIAALA
jgi:hypothetical protein